MLVIKAELWPGGWEDRKETIGKMSIINDGTGSESHGNYHTITMAMPGPAVVGQVTDFPRKEKHVWDLVYEALKGTLDDETVDRDLGEDEEREEHAG